MTLPSRANLARWVLPALALLLVVALVADQWAGSSTIEERPGSDGRRGGGGHASAGVPTAAKPLAGRVLGTIGVASYNVLRHLPLERARADWDRITSRRDLDLIGWQESKSPAFRELYPEYRSRGWETWRWPDADGPISLAFSWRPDVLTLLDVHFTKMHRGGYPRETSSPFPARWVVTAQFRHLPTGLTLTLLNTHVNQHIETGDGFEDNLNARFAKRHLAWLAGLWDTAPGDVVVGTGDYNFDNADDTAARPAGGITRRFAGHATSSYGALGRDGLLPTRNTRWIDYVFLADRTLRTARDRPGSGGAAQFVRHRVLRGFNSDHRPLVARIRLYDVG